MLEALHHWWRPSPILFGGLPLAFGMLGAFAEFTVFLFTMLYVPFGALSLLMIAVLAGRDLWRWACDDGAARAAILLPFAVPLLLLAALPVLASVSFGTGGRVGTILRLAINLPVYREIVAKAERSRAPIDFAEYRDVTYIVDPGPPVRVAFNPAGILDNWSGIIFDPSGRVMEADGWEASGKFRAPEDITKLFGGDLVSCRHLWGDFYDCLFT